VKVGDALVAVASSGLHSNGFSLARRVLLTELGWGLGQHIDDLGRALGDELLEPTRIYARPAQALATSLGKDLHAMSHITGGGVVGNLPRVLDKGQLASVHMTHEVPPVFGLIAKNGPVNQAEMLRTFNMGIGLVCIVTAARADEAVDVLQQAGQKAWTFGEIVAGESPDAPARLRVEEA
jgi:phosphoribosylformylglycinamidine cyclo-ligase